MGFGERDRPGMYAPQGSSSPLRDSLEVVLAQFETTLEQHSTLIERMVQKVEGMDRTLVEVKTQMEHLVTKESCAEGRRILAEDLKARMDGDREITGVGITVPKLWQQYAQAIQATDAQGGTSTSQKSKGTTSIPPPPKTVMYYVKAVSSIISLVFAVLAITFFAFKMIARLDEQQEAMQQQQAVMQDIQRELKQIDVVERVRPVPVDRVPVIPAPTPPQPTPNPRSIKNH